MEQVPLILVGGFLGAGKTTLLGKAGQLLMKQGKRVGLITNDQASNLVDTEVLRQAGFGVKEVGGGCFCCRFRDLVSASRRLVEEQRPDVLIGEPVGSCTDLSATVLQPLNAFFSDRFRIAPFSVVVDPERLKDLLAGQGGGPLAEKVLYIYGKQLEEADMILLNKTDLLPSEETKRLTGLLADRFPKADVRAFSALEGAGVEQWLEDVLGATRGPVRDIEIDYDTYADGEALLGWLNASVHLSASKPLDWRKVCMALLKELKRQLQAGGAEVAHVKISLTGNGNALIGNLTSTAGHPFLVVTGVSEALGTEAFLILNARVQAEPAMLQSAVENSLEHIKSDELVLDLKRMECLQPGRPEPAYRMGGGARNARLGAAPREEDCEVDADQVCGVIRNIFKPKRDSKGSSDQ